MKSLQTSTKVLNKAFQESRNDCIIHPDNYSPEEKIYLGVTEADYRRADNNDNYIIQTTPIDTEGVPEDVDFTREDPRKVKVDKEHD